MMYFLGILVVVSLSMFMVSRFIVWLGTKAARVSITEHFIDAEFILNQHRVPERWSTRPSLFTRLMQGSKPKFTKQESSQSFYLEKLDGLIRFFETCPFVQDEETRTVLLEQLTQERNHWQTKAMSEIA